MIQNEPTASKPKIPKAYLIFVISFTRAKFSENKIYTEKRVNYKKHISRQNRVNQDLLGKEKKKVCNPTR